MNLENIFKNVIKIDFLYGILIITFSFFTESEVTYVDSDAPWAMIDTFGILAIILVIVYLVNLYFLYKFKPIGKTLYVPLLILYLILGSLILQEQYAFSALDMLGEWISGILSGLIIALLYFTDIKDKFTKI